MSKVLFNIFYVFLWLITLLPLRALYCISDAIFVLLFWIIRYRRKVVQKNLLFSFPEKSEKERGKIERRFYRHLCDYFFETIKLIHISDEEVFRRIHYHSDYLKVKAQEEKNVVALLGHCSNWEWLTSIAMHDDYHWAVPYMPLNSSKHFDEFMVKLRSKFTAEPVPMKSIYKRLIEINKSGELFVAGMIADQSPPDVKNRHWVTFMNQDTAVMEGAERIAQKTNASVVYCKMIKVKRGYYDIEIIPICENAQEVEDFYVTKKFFSLLEEHINEQPEYWLWTHRRWKRSRPQNEKHIRK